MLVLLADLEDLRYLGRGRSPNEVLARALDGLLALGAPPLLRVEVHAVAPGTPEEHEVLAQIRRFPAPVRILPSPRVADARGEHHPGYTRALLRSRIAASAFRYLIHRPNPVTMLAFSWGDLAYAPVMELIQDHGLQTAVLGDPHPQVLPYVDLILPLAAETPKKKQGVEQRR